MRAATYERQSVCELKGAHFRSWWRAGKKCELPGKQKCDTGRSEK